MNKSKRKNPFYNNSSREKTTANSDDYDLKKNFQKVNSKSKTYKKNREETYYTDSSFFSRGNINDADSPEPVTRSDSPSWETYTRLEDKISSYDKSNLEAHKDLRIELEGKISKVDDKLDKYLPMAWYKWTLTALGALVGIFYLFSYSGIVQLPEKIRKIEGNLEKIENTINESKNINIETKVDSTSQSKNKTKER